MINYADVAGQRRADLHAAADHHRLVACAKAAQAAKAVESRSIRGARWWMWAVRRPTGGQADRGGIPSPRSACSRGSSSVARSWSS
jgi:hypothetical protein